MPIFPLVFPFAFNFTVPVAPTGSTAGLFKTVFGATQQDIGLDVSTVPTLDPSFSLISGPRVIAEALLRRYQTERGTLVDDPNYGRDLRKYLNSRLYQLSGVQGQTTLSQVQQDIVGEAREDERVSSASASLTYSHASKQLFADVAVDSTAGPFTMVIGVTKATVSLLGLNFSGAGG